MKEYKLVEITPEEFREECKKRIAEDGLYRAVEEELDEIVCIARALGYMGFSETAERAQTILTLIELSEKKGKRKNESR